MAKSNRRPKTKSTVEEITVKTPLQHVYRELIRYAARKDFEETMQEARTWYFFRALWSDDQRPSEELERTFVQWMIFDFRRRLNAPTILERFATSHAVDPETEEAIRDLGGGRNGFFRVLGVESEKGGAKRLSMVELGRETHGRIEVSIETDRDLGEDDVLEGRLGFWQEAFRFVGSFHAMDSEQMKAMEGPLRSLRQTHDTPELWAPLVSMLKAQLIQRLELGHDVEGWLKGLSEAGLVTGDKISARYVLEDMRSGNIERAVKIARETFEDYPESDVARRIYAQALGASGQFEDALKMMRAAIAESPDDVDLRIFVGEMLASEDRTDEVLEVLEPCMKLKNHERYNEVLCRMGISNYRLGKADLGRSMMRESAELKPEDAMISASCAAVLIDGEEYGEALKYVETLLEQQPDAPHLIIMHGRCLDGLGDYAGAITQYDRAARAVSPEPTLLKRIATAAINLGRLNRATVAYESCLRLDNDDTEAACRMVEVLRMRGRDHQARPMWANLLQEHGDHPEVLALREKFSADGGSTE